MRLGKRLSFPNDRFGIFADFSLCLGIVLVLPFGQNSQFFQLGEFFENAPPLVILIPAVMSSQMLDHAARAAVFHEDGRTTD